MVDISDLVRKEVINRREMETLVGGPSIWYRFFRDNDMISLERKYIDGTPYDIAYERFGEPHEIQYKRVQYQKSI